MENIIILKNLVEAKEDSIESALKGLIDNANEEVCGLLTPCTTYDILDANLSAYYRYKHVKDDVIMYIEDDIIDIENSHDRVLKPDDIQSIGDRVARLITFEGNYNGNLPYIDNIANHVNDIIEAKSFWENI